MEKEHYYIRKKNKDLYVFKDNVFVVFKDCYGYRLDEIILKIANNSDIFTGSNSNITCGNNCEIDCGSFCNIICGNNCKINSTNDCTITCGNNCLIDCGGNCNIISGNNSIVDCLKECYIKAGEGSNITPYDKLEKTITKDEEHIWWYVNAYLKFINTYEDIVWKENNPDKLKELYPFVHNELDSATLF